MVYLGFRSPKGFTQYGDVLENVVEKVNDELSSYKETVKRIPYKEFKSKDSRIVIFKFTEQDKSLGIKIPIYLESVSSILSEKEHLSDIKYVSDFRENIYVAYKFILK